MSKFTETLKSYCEQYDVTLNEAPLSPGQREGQPPPAVQPPASDPAIGQQEDQAQQNSITSANVVTFTQLLLKALQTDPNNISAADKTIFMKTVTPENAMDIIKQVTNMMQTV